MRTTLKKGTRQSANGNGEYAPGPPPLVESPLRVSPPPPPTPPVAVAAAGGDRAFYRVRRNPLKLLAKGVMWLILLVLVAAGALAGGVKMYFDYSVSAIQADDPEVIEAVEDLTLPEEGKPATAIVIGYDKRAGEVSAGRSDTVMLLRVDPQKDVVTMLSFPRDLIVEHPGCEGHPGWSGRINEAYAYCGPRGTLTTVKELTGVPINYMITVNFRAFRNIVDKLGGVYMDVDRRYFNDNSGATIGTYATINLKPGYQRLDGREALDFVRFRHTDSDLYRVVRQQEFVKAVKQRISSAWDVFQLPGIVKAITENIQVAKGGGKAISSGEVLGYANALYGLPAGNFQQVPLDGITGYNELSLDTASLDSAVRHFLNPDVKAGDKAVAVATGAKPKGENAPPPSQTSVEVLNGSGVAGAADEAAVLLGQVGYKTENGGNAENFNYFRTTVLYEPEIDKAEAAAQGLADLFGEAQVKPAPASQPLTTMARVIVGKTFQGTLGPAPPDDTPERQKPEVVVDPSSIQPALRALRKKVDFRIMVPTVREDGSSIDDDQGIRVYKIDDHKALRLTYHTGSNEYWGIQQTSWEDPPILEEPTLERTIRGRNYKFFFSGARLHIIAFEENGATYWIVNTLRNKLSNETMLAIAKGMKPQASK
jgi:LCP family protein required for cell wall assembly